MISYNGNLSYNNKLNAGFTTSAIFGALKYKFVYNNSEQTGLYLFGFKLKESKAKDDENTSEEIKQESIDESLKKGLDILTDEKTGVAFSAIKGNLFKLIKHIFPRDIRGRFIFGFEDPYYTGKLLELFALLYAGAGDNLYVEPVWESRPFEADLSMSGKICTVYVLILILKIILNKDFREFRRKYYGE